MKKFKLLLKILLIVIASSIILLIYLQFNPSAITYQVAILSFKEEPIKFNEGNYSRLLSDFYKEQGINASPSELQINYSIITSNNESDYMLLFEDILNKVRLYLITSLNLTDEELTNYLLQLNRSLVQLTSLLFNHEIYLPTPSAELINGYQILAFEYPVNGYKCYHYYDNEVMNLPEIQALFPYDPNLVNKVTSAYYKSCDVYLKDGTTTNVKVYVLVLNSQSEAFYNLIDCSSQIEELKINKFDQFTTCNETNTIAIGLVNNSIIKVNYSKINNDVYPSLLDYFDFYKNFV